MVIKYLPLVLIVFGFYCCAPKSSQDDFQSVKVIKVWDGDTFDILLPNNREERIRMEGIDAPERGMPFYNKSKKHLKHLIGDKNVRLVVTGEDRNGRILAYTYNADSLELSLAMIEEGLAWHYKKYNDEEHLSNAEIEARAKKANIWSDPNPMPPWVNKSLHRKRVSTKDSFDIQPGEE